MGAIEEAKVTTKLKVEGARTNTPPQTDTYKLFPTANTLLPRIVSHGVMYKRPGSYSDGSRCH